MSVNRAIQVQSYAEDLNGIEVVDRPVPVPAEGEVLVRIFLRPVNPSDILLLTGLFEQAMQPPVVMGGEGIGLVKTDGAIFRRGQRVVAAPWPTFSGEGTWQHYVCVAEDALVAVPDAISDDAAAQFFINPVTAFGLLDSIDVPPGKYILQSAAASTLGRMIIALAAAKGINVINVVRREEQKAELHALGARVVIATDTEDVAERVRDITGAEGAEAVIDLIGGEWTGKLMSALRPGGTCFLVGAMGGQEIKVNFFDITGLGKNLSSFQIWGYLASIDDADQKLRDVMQLMADGVIVPPEGIRYPMEEFKTAIKHSKQQGRVGKVLLEG